MSWEDEVFCSCCDAWIPGDVFTNGDLELCEDCYEELEAS